MEEIQSWLSSVVLEIFGVEILPEVTVAPEEMKADFSSNIAMQLTRELHTAPREIAEKIIGALNDNTEFSSQFNVEIAGPGFLNFISSDEYFKQKLVDYRTNFEKNISQNGYSGKTVVCEFSDPNPFKVLHVGHLYTSIVGDAVSRLVEFAGGRVIRANFGGDVGLHVAKTLYAVMKDDTDTSDIETIAKCYVEGTNAYEEDEQAKAEITRLNKLIYQIAESGEKESKLAKLYWMGREVSYKYFEDFYARVGVKFDKYYPESTVAGRGLKEVSEHIGEVYEKSDGAVVFPGEKYDLHTRVFINAEGLPTYEAKDVGLLFTKWDDYKFDKSIVITGNDIIDYMKVVLKSESLYAPELVEKTKHITHGNVRLPGNEKMSSRKGNFVRAVDVLDSVSKLVPDEKVALSAIKYAFLKYRIGGNIEFDARESVSTTGNSGVYLQYSSVRAKKILAKPMTGGSGEWKLNEYERKMIRKILEYKAVLENAVSEFAPHKIANYLFEISQDFSRFYENVKVAGSKNEKERREIVAAYLDVMTHGLNLMGIEVPEEM